MSSSRSQVDSAARNNAKRVKRNAAKLLEDSLSEWKASNDSRDLFVEWVDETDNVQECNNATAFDENDVAKSCEVESKDEPEPGEYLPETCCEATTAESFEPGDDSDCKSSRSLEVLDGVFKCDVCENCSGLMYDDKINCEHCEKSCIQDDNADNSTDDFEFDENCELNISVESKRNQAIEEDFKEIVLERGVNQNVVDDLLKFFNKWNFGDFPKSAKTLIRTPNEIHIKKVDPGEYWHRGITQDIVNFIKMSECSKVHITFSIDGLPLSHSSNNCFWPISCSFNESKEVVLAGIYFGAEKPANSNEFLSDFIEEVKNLCDSGVMHGNDIIPVELFCAVCDAPAKSFMLMVKGHTGYFGCCKCTQEGEMVGRRMAYLESNSELRSDESFLSQKQEDHHKGVSLLTSVKSFRPVSGVPLDYMHLVLLGTMRKLVYLMLAGPLKVRLKASLVEKLSQQLINAAEWVPREFVRKPRSLKYVKRFKATEWRMLLFYLGPVVFFSVLPKDLYNHFLVLHVAMTILAHPRIHTQLNSINYAQSLLMYFVETFKQLYGDEFVSYNIHNLLHLPDDVLNYGSIENFSAFKFENFLQHLKKMIRKGEKPLQQLARRYCEIESGLDQQNSTGSHGQTGEKFLFFKGHNDGPLPLDCVNPQFTLMKISGSGVVCSSSKPNNCCILNDGSIVCIENFAYSKKEKSPVIIGRKFLEAHNLYCLPCNSSLLKIQCVSKLSSVCSWPVANVNAKCFQVPFKESYAVFPLLHCDF